jgi:hypothetical protein
MRSHQTSPHPQSVPGPGLELTSLAWARDTVSNEWRTFAAFLDGSVAEVGPDHPPGYLRQLSSTVPTSCSTEKCQALQAAWWHGVLASQRAGPSPPPHRRPPAAPLTCSQVVWRQALVAHSQESYGGVVWALVASPPGCARPGEVPLELAAMSLVGCSTTAHAPACLTTQSALPAQLRSRQSRLLQRLTRLRPTLPPPRLRAHAGGRVRRRQRAPVRLRGRRAGPQRRARAGSPAGPPAVRRLDRGRHGAGRGRQRRHRAPARRHLGCAAARLLRCFGREAMQQLMQELCRRGGAPQPQSSAGQAAAMTGSGPWLCPDAQTLAAAPGVTPAPPPCAPPARRPRDAAHHRLLRHQPNRNGATTARPPRQLVPLCAHVLCELVAPASP